MSKKSFGVLKCIGLKRKFSNFPYSKILQWFLRNQNIILFVDFGLWNYYFFVIFHQNIWVQLSDPKNGKKKCWFQTWKYKLMCKKWCQYFWFQYRYQCNSFWYVNCMPLLIYLQNYSIDPLTIRLGQPFEKLNFELKWPKCHCNANNILLGQN